MLFFLVIKSVTKTHTLTTAIECIIFQNLFFFSGMVAFDTQSGFWLMHSVPRFGEMSKYEYPKTALMNGQSAICVTFNTPSLNEICK